MSCNVVLERSSGERQRYVRSINRPSNMTSQFERKSSLSSILRHSSFVLAACRKLITCLTSPVSFTRTVSMAK